MFCKTCGGEVNDNAVICLKCGCAVKEVKEQTAPLQVPFSTTFMVLIGILTALCPIVGGAVGVYGLCSNNPTKKSQGGILIGIAMVFFVGYLLLIQSGGM